MKKAAWARYWRGQSYGDRLQCNIVIEDLNFGPLDWRVIDFHGLNCHGAPPYCKPFNAAPLPCMPVPPSVPDARAALRPFARPALAISQNDGTADWRSVGKSVHSTAGR